MLFVRAEYTESALRNRKKEASPSVPHPYVSIVIADVLVVDRMVSRDVKLR